MRNVSPSRVNVLGVGMHTVDIDTAVAHIDQRISVREQGYVCATGVHGIIESQNDAKLRDILNNAFLNVPDGKPTVWAGRLFGGTGIGHVPGPDLMLRVCEMSVASGYTHFFYGGRDGVAEKLRTSLQARFPGLKVVGTYTPPFRELNSTEEAELHSILDACRPDMLWVGISTPKQERFMAQHCFRLPVTLMFGVGAAFDFHSGVAKDSPQWMKRAGLAWLFRLLREPRRLMRRYVTIIPAFLTGVAAQWLKLREYSMTPAERHEPNALVTSVPSTSPMKHQKPS
jgi:N-acetylglucosaminyldiphosphoundecaprenol N-acetyl-beta-D-mannosaminyltransferase